MLDGRWMKTGKSAWLTGDEELITERQAHGGQIQGGPGQGGTSHRG